MAETEMGEAVALLRSWNGQMEKQTAAPLLITLAYDQLRKAAVHAAWPGAADIYRPYMAPRRSSGFSNRAARFFRDEDDALLAALAPASRRQEDARQQPGALGLRPLQPAHHQTSGWEPAADGRNVFQHRAGGDERFGTTIKQTSVALGPSMRFIADLANWDGSLNNIDIGQSGQILSRHYKDQWDAYYVGRSFPMQFEKVEARNGRETGGAETS
jgi:penicillin amidase